MTHASSKRLQTRVALYDDAGEVDPLNQHSLAAPSPFVVHFIRKAQANLIGRHGAQFKPSIHYDVHRFQTEHFAQQRGALMALSARWRHRQHMQQTYIPKI